MRARAFARRVPRSPKLREGGPSRSPFSSPAAAAIWRRSSERSAADSRADRHAGRRPVLETDTAESLADRMLTIEPGIYPQAIQRVLDGAWTIEGRRVIFRQS
ncbi:MAG: hypothetical protein ACM4AI_02580 [Acidobacteriota bacterium]